MNGSSFKAGIWGKGKVSGGRGGMRVKFPTLAIKNNNKKLHYKILSGAVVAIACPSYTPGVPLRRQE